MLLKRRYFIFSFFLLFNLLSLTSNFSAPHDSINYLNGLEDAKDLFHPHHLLYHITTFIFFKAFKVLLPFIANHYLIEAVNAIWGAAAMLVVNLFLQNRFSVKPFTAFLGTCLPAFSFGIWFYSANIEVYLPPLFFILLLLYTLTKENFTSRDFIIVILLHVTAILFHQVNVLLIPVVLLKIWQERQKKQLFQNLSRYAIFGGGLIAIAYFAVAWLVLDLQSKEEFMTWVKGYSSKSEYWFPLSLKTVINAAVGIGHAFVGAHFLFRVPFIRDYINSKFFYHSLNDELFLVRDISSQEAMLLFILTIVFLLMLFLSFTKAVVRSREFFKSKKNLMAIVGSGFTIYTVFFFFWMPENLEFWLLQVVLLWIFIVAGISRRAAVLRIKINVWLGIMAVLLFIINYFGSIRWLQDINHDYFYAKIEKVKNEAVEKDLILLKDGWIIREYLHRYSKAPAIFIPEPGNDSTRKIIDSRINHTLSSGNKIYLFTDGSFMHAIKNQEYIDSLLEANAGRTDTLHTSLSNMKIIHPYK